MTCGTHVGCGRGGHDDAVRPGGRGNGGDNLSGDSTPQSTERERSDDEPGLLDEVAEKLGFRARLKANPALDMAWRIGVGVVGVLVVLLGLFLVPFPGPGWLIVFVGLGILATEFAWAERLLDYGRGKWRAWIGWVSKQSLPIRFLIGAGFLLLLGVLAAAFVAVYGMPFVGD